MACAAMAFFMDKKTTSYYHDILQTVNMITGKRKIFDSPLAIHFSKVSKY
jgi:hypothetical protein